MLVRVAIGLTVGPLVLSLVHLLTAVGGDYHPHGDLATSEMYVRDLGRYLLVVGPYSRDGWFHPGPAFFYLFVVPYRLLGGSSLGLPAGAVLVNGASVVGMALIARRRGGMPALLCTLVACSLLLRAFGFEPFLRSAWNPHITVLSYGLLLFLTWAMLCGDRWALPVATFVASFLAQTHIAYVALALPLLGLGVAAFLAPGLRHLAGSRRWAALARLRPALLATSAVAAVMWVLPIYQQVTADPGNLRRIVRYFREGGETHTVGEAWRVLSAQYALLPEWLAGASDPTFLGEPRYMYSAVLPVLLVPVVVAAVALWRQGGTAARNLVGLWVFASVVGMVATVRTVGLMFAYRLGWAWVLGMVGGIIVLWAGWELLVRRRSTADRLLVVTSLVVLAGFAAVNGVSAVTAGTPEADESRTADDLGASVRDWLPERDGDVLVVGTSFGALIHGASIRLDLERHGISAKVPDGDDLHGRERTYHGGPLRARLIVAVDEDVVRDLANPDLELVAYSGRMSRAELVDVVERRRAVEARHRAGEISDHELTRRVQALNSQDVAVAVFADRRLPG